MIRPPIALAQIAINESERQGVSPSLVMAQIHVESNWNTKAISPAGAQGLMQLMPRTALDLGVENPFIAEENVRGGVSYIRQMLNRFGNIKLALAGYNAGPGNVEKYGRKIPPFNETQKYVARVLSFIPQYEEWFRIAQGQSTVKSFFKNQPPIDPSEGGAVAYNPILLLGGGVLIIILLGTIIGR